MQALYLMSLEPIAETWLSCTTKSSPGRSNCFPKHPMEEGINYALNHWEELNMFLSDGAVEIDKNVSEREMKRVILNRKNSLFVGNARGGRTAAILASLTSAAVAMIWTRNSISPSCWLTVRQRESRICWTGYQTAGKPRRKYAGHSINQAPTARSTSSSRNAHCTPGGSSRVSRSLMALRNKGTHSSAPNSNLRHRPPRQRDSAHFVFPGRKCGFRCLR